MSIYLKYISISFFIVSVAVIIQFKYNIAINSISPYAMLVPILVATIFGIIIAKIRILQTSYQESLASLQEEIKKNAQKDRLLSKHAEFIAKAEILNTVSHHWKQPLSALSLLIQDIEDAIDHNEVNNDYLREFSQKSLKLVGDMDKTVDIFKNIFATDIIAKKEFLIKDAVEKALFVAKPRIEKDLIQVSLDYQNPEIKLGSHEREYIQATLNIVSNAIDALESKKDDKKIVISLYEDENKKSVLEIFDNAEPIPQDIINKIFDPYFSTKLAKNGTGLGLFTSKNSIEIKMGGKLIAQNKSNGVSFKIVI